MHDKKECNPGSWGSFASLGWCTTGSTDVKKECQVLFTAIRQSSLSRDSETYKMFELCQAGKPFTEQGRVEARIKKQCLAEQRKEYPGYVSRGGTVSEKEYLAAFCD